MTVKNFKGYIMHNLKTPSIDLTKLFNRTRTAIENSNGSPMKDGLLADARVQAFITTQFGFRSWHELQVAFNKKESQAKANHSDNPIIPLVLMYIESFLLKYDNHIENEVENGKEINTYFSPEIFYYFSQHHNVYNHDNNNLKIIEGLSDPKLINSNLENSFKEALTENAQNLSFHDMQATIYGSAYVGLIKDTIIKIDELINLQQSRVGYNHKTLIELINSNINFLFFSPPSKTKNIHVLRSEITLVHDSKVQDFLDMQNELESIGMEFAQGNDVIESRRDQELSQLMNLSNLEFDMDSGKVVRSEDPVLTDANIISIEAKYNQDITNSCLSFGGVTLTNDVTKRSFMLDIDQTYRKGNKVTCELKNISSLIDENTFPDEEYNLTINDLLSKKTIICAHFGDDPEDVKPISALLKILINGKEYSFYVLPE
jgi:hypothetical protein